MYVVEGVVMRRESEQMANKFSGRGLEAESWDERNWDLRAFKNICKNFDLEGVYNTYMLRLQRSFLSIFLVIETFFGLLHTIILVVQATKTNASITVEVFAYLMTILIVWLSLFVTFREEQVKKRSWLPFAASCAALFFLIIADLAVPLYHEMYTFPKPPLRPAYACHILLSIYIFFPLMNNWHAMLLALATTIAYLVELAMVTYRLDEHRSLKVISECLFMLGINLLGLYYRMTFEITIRRTLLDRRQCVEGNLVLQFQREQERNLLLSILPEHTANALEKNVSHMIRRIRKERNNSTENKNPTIMAFWRGHEIRSFSGSYYVETHDDVSILYADVVNYTKMTTKLKVKPLVETLHELFVKFDQASEENGVLRIKFLGDCYYCVAGVPVKNANHARSCVELGLRMIRDIQEVRQKRDLDINMRIGIHSGSIISGIIGACKWQYDIWSKDVVIANKMESTGEPGKLHITQQTLELLRGNYQFTEGTQKAKNDPILQEHGIKTFLIAPPPTPEIFEEGARRQSRIGGGVQRLLNRAALIPPARTSELTSVKNFMRDSIEHYRQIMRQINVEMIRELNLMPIGKFHFNKIFSGSKGRRQTEIDLEKRQLTSLSMIFLCFKNRSDEWPFLNEPDHLLKYSILAGFIVYMLVFGIQILNQPYGVRISSATIVGGMLLLIFVPFAWFKRLWLIFTPEMDEDERAAPVPKWAITRHVLRLSNWIPRNAVARTVIYIVSISLLTMLSFIHMTRVRDTTQQIEGQEVKSDLGAELMPTKYINAWAVTHCLILTICMNFLFLKIHFMVKFSVGLLICVFYLWLVLSGASTIFTESSSTNVILDAQVAHLMAIFFTFFTIHLVDRQSEYISRIDYNWKKQLLKKQEEAEVTKDSNNFLVQNILPAHVAEIYINLKQKDELYHEEFDDVAVMFATITNFNFQADALNILNEIIYDFDARLLGKPRSLHIEKIKVAGWTYMAACGLQSRWADSSSTLGGHPDIAVRVSNGRRNYSFGRESDNNPTNKVKRKLTKLTDPVYVLTEFALELMEALRSFNEENFNDGQLRIGISNGEIMAGVVGSSKPLYDIWGDAVNMASRMDSTGLPGHIQVTPNTAQRLKDLGVQCECRGFREIKGAGQILTYFVGVDEDLKLIPEEHSEQEVTEL
ncbi:adenylyl cyclase X E-like isoform X2 [Phlebotomus argentipes]|uniref:adenylyl cyclase X E-like isoform X2 n=1 Tax=Phlebotomus argentipes TaxID=94469 RepID=UPI002892BAA9|nr:adenylyl cyclase X E-like isoform X2 [Phlebotomus argentipes]